MRWSKIMMSGKRDNDAMIAKDLFKCEEGEHERKTGEKEKREGRVAAAAATAAAKLILSVRPSSFISFFPPSSSLARLWSNYIWTFACALAFDRPTDKRNKRERKKEIRKEREREKEGSIDDSCFSSSLLPQKQDDDSRAKAAWLARLVAICSFRAFFLSFSLFEISLSQIETTAIFLLPRTSERANERTNERKPRQFCLWNVLLLTYQLTVRRGPPT